MRERPNSASFTQILSSNLRRVLGSDAAFFLQIQPSRPFYWVEAMRIVLL